MGYKPGSKTLEIIYGIEAQLLKTLQLKWNFTYDIIDTNNSWGHKLPNGLFPNGSIINLIQSGASTYFGQINSYIYMSFASPNDFCVTF